MSSSSDEELLLLLLACRKRRKWVHEINEKREEFGEYHRLCRELNSFKDKFFIYFKMSREQFETLHELVDEKICKISTNWRRPIGSRERLAICLRYLATGDSHQTIAFSFRVGQSTVTSIVNDVCIQLWKVLQPLYLPQPTEEIWRKSEYGYRLRWNYPNCIGSIDGKHVKITCPSNSGSNYFCYKNFFSLVLLAIVDPEYNFILVDIGSYGRQSDSSIFENSAFYNQYLRANTILPPKPLPGTVIPVPHVLIGDEGFKLQTFLMRPFPKSVALQDERKRVYNKRHCRARRVVENTFGILVQKWRVFLRPIQLNPDSVVNVVKAACCLHNYIRMGSTERDQEEEEEIENLRLGAFENANPSRERSSEAAYAVRELC